MCSLCSFPGRFSSFPLSRSPHVLYEVRIFSLECSYALYNNATVYATHRRERERESAAGREYRKTSLFLLITSSNNITLKGERHNAEIYCFNLFLWGVTLKNSYGPVLLRALLLILTFCEQRCVECTDKFASCTRRSQLAK